MYLRFGKIAAGGDPIASAIADYMTLLGDWVAPLASAGSIATGAAAMVDVSGEGAPDVLSSNGGASRHIIQTSSPPAGMDTWVDMTNHFATEYIAIASALSGSYRCGGIIFKVSALSPGEIALFDVAGTHGSPTDRSDGTRTGSAFITDWSGIFPGAVPPVVTNVPRDDSHDAGGWFTGPTSANTGWVHLQWRTTSSGAAPVRSYLSKIGGTWAEFQDSSIANGYIDSPGNCAVAGISDKFQVGHAGSHDSGVLGIARIYLGSDAALDAASLQAIHEAFV